MAIGIRADEIDRMSPNATDNGLVYPLVKWGVRKQDVLSWWAQQEFDLNVPEHRGNCVTCWKKSDRKLFTIARETPDEFDFFRVMEYNYADVGAGCGGRVFFRGERSTEQMLDEARKPFRLFEPDSELQFEMDMLDLGGGCGESCEIFSE